MLMNDKEVIRKKAKGYALRLLKLRPRSTAEISRKMADKGYEQAIISEVIDGLARMGFIDDAAFAKAWLQYRLNRPMGFRRVERELIEKGIAKDVIRGHWAEVKENYDELEVVRALAKKRARQYNNIDPLKRKKRVMDYLARRGFQLDVMMKVIKEI
jgi:regulatory protein